MKKINVLHIYKTYYPETFGGIENFIYSLTDGLNKKKFNLTILTISNKNKTQYINNIKVIKKKKTFEISSCPFSLKMLNDFKGILHKFNIIHFHFPWPFMDLLSILFCHKFKNIVCTYHSDIVNQKFLKILYNPLMLVFLNKVKFLIATSKIYLKSSNVLTRYRKKTKVIPLGINPIKNKLGKRIDNRINNLINVKKNYALFVGVLRYYKGLEKLILSFKTLNYNLIIAGEGPCKKNLLKIINYHEIKNVKLIGKVNEDEKDYLYKNCNFFVMPSNHRSEAYGISLVEASSYKKAMITCEINTGTSYVNLHNRTGYVAKVNSLKSLKFFLNKLINNPKKQREMGMYAFQRYLKYFQAKKMVRAYEKLYYKVLNE